MSIPFKRADILIPKKVDMKKWSVVACDQYTSELEYWKEVESIVGEEPSTLNLIVPEIYLGEEHVERRIKKVNEDMYSYLNSGLFEELTDSIIYVERTGTNGKIRKGIIGIIDLEEYSYEEGSNNLIRTTEGTVLERIPPRVKVRKDAELELPHIMLLIDDEKKDIIDSLEVSNNPVVYDFDLMQNGGRIKGYKLDDLQIQTIFNGLEELADGKNFKKRYGIENKDVLLFSVGDGNHSLATAKTCYEEIKKTLAKEEYENHPARYALVEIVNVHNSALEFEPIHRVVFGVDAEDMINQFKKYYDVSEEDGEQKIEYIYRDKKGELYIKDPKSNLAVGSLQMFIDEYLKNNEGKVDYIHGDDVVEKLARDDGNIGFLLPNMNKTDLFKTVILDGVLPRKTFSMGHSNDKRFYLEARKIK